MRVDNALNIGMTERQQQADHPDLRRGGGLRRQSRTAIRSGGQARVVPQLPYHPARRPRRCDYVDGAIGVQVLRAGRHRSSDTDNKIASTKGNILCCCKHPGITGRTVAGEPARPRTAP
jgi:hypothetical protein